MLIPVYPQNILAIKLQNMDTYLRRAPFWSSGNKFNIPVHEKWALAQRLDILIPSVSLNCNHQMAIMLWTVSDVLKTIPSVHLINSGKMYQYDGDRCTVTVHLKSWHKSKHWTYDGREKIFAHFNMSRQQHANVHFLLCFPPYLLFKGSGARV